MTEQESGHAVAELLPPPGWTLQEIRDVSGDREAVVLSPDRVVKWVASDGPDEALNPEFVLGFHGLCLVKAVRDDDWYMGSLYDDGSVDCWDAYSNLREALRGL
ncbi:hypothetical protein [Streptomyces sp. NBC_00102]|uniref:hypothetical protein n=1 Tax=Streptomyces sp. NBC_00102 TaxID=2975652 RepID=UPI002256EFAE|nr:hypothetical protein [Streptomyces sp. NBC_00102]MCX5397088.1 hypothetical protein [Streptomyces sp. NBC_00102]